MTSRDDEPAPLGGLLDTPDLASALENDRFRQFLDHLPFAVAVAELQPRERITYANPEFQRLAGEGASGIVGKPWSLVAAVAGAEDGERKLIEALDAAATDPGVEDYVGLFQITQGETPLAIDVWLNLIEDDQGAPVFRLLAMAQNRERDAAQLEAYEKRVKEKDTLLRELQHRVKNNLQMITALIRLETRNMPDDAVGGAFERLAGRVEALALLYRSMSEADAGETIDLGIYLSQIAAAVMRAHAVEGIRLDLKVDSWPVSVNVAMPTGLVVNELLTNALKHAFEGRDGGTITLHSLVDEKGCRVVIADDGNGLPEGVEWPKPDRLGAMIVQSLRQNAAARLDVVSSPGQGLRVTIRFARDDAA
ncbi:sensor histidine kinase [Roseococcus sp.]|uniref:sensor histidine kinase n=1 Tax=Roseococcus sp. TaxID=2109646 RepID=UPI003BADA375